MRDFRNSKLSVNPVVLRGDQLIIEEPGVVRLKDNHEAFYKVESSAMGQLFSNYIPMGGRQFTNKLFGIDPGIWSTLMNKLLVNNPDYQKKYNEARFITIDDKVVSITDYDPAISILLEVLNKISENTELVISYDYSNYVLQVLIEKSLDSQLTPAVAIQVWLNDNYIMVWDSILDNRYDGKKTIALGIVPVIDGEFTQEVVNTIDVDYILQLASTGIESGWDNYNSALSTALSLNELLEYNKSAGCTIEYDDETEIEAQYKDDPINKFYATGMLVLMRQFNSTVGVLRKLPYLKKASMVVEGSSFVSIADLYSDVIMSDDKHNITFNDIYNMYKTIMRNQSDYDYLNVSL